MSAARTETVRTETVRTETVRTVSARSGVRRAWRVTWRPHRIRCCANEEPALVVTADDPAPVLNFDPDSDGGLVLRHGQCGRCGSVHRARATIEEDETPDRPCTDCRDAS